MSSRRKPAVDCAIGSQFPAAKKRGAYAPRSPRSQFLKKANSRRAVTAVEPAGGVGKRIGLFHAPTCLLNHMLTTARMWGFAVSKI